MRIAFCGKGGSGKTTIASLFIKYLTHKGDEILAIDGDINQHLSNSLGLDIEKIKSLPRLGHQIKVLKEYVAGRNLRVKSEHIIESTPAGHGSNFITFDGNDPVSHHFILKEKNLRFMAIGGHEDDDVGKTCYHKFTGAEGIFLNHLLDQNTEFVIGDMCAGADPFASSGLASRYDGIYLVLEPTLKSIGVYEQARQYADPFGIRLFVIANKITSPEDIAFIEEKINQKCLCTFGDMAFVRDFEKGKDYTISSLDPSVMDTLETMRSVSLSLGERDWKGYIENGKFFHKRSCDGWANARFRINLQDQIDPDFDYQFAYKAYKKAA